MKEEPLDFIRAIVAADQRAGKHDGRIHTRFPPEPNGYLHIGHAKSICLNFGIASEFGGLCNLRFDDTDPTKEDMKYVESMQRDIKWLGFDWDHRLYFASDYFEKLYELAVQLVQAGKAYVCDLSEEEIRSTRGTVTEPGSNSPYRNRSVEENLDLFARMRAGEFEDGSKTLRAKIDMAAPNMKMRDPLMYRIRKAHHYRTGDAWSIYPMYDWAHGQSDSIEGITHSICTLEFVPNRELYDWFIEQLGIFPSRQYEFARLNLSHTVLSKRRLIQLVEEGIVDGWDDPRMPTLAGFRRRGFTPEAIRSFCDAIGVAKYNGIIQASVLDLHLRDDLNRRAPRVMAVLKPLKLVINNYPEGQVEEFEAINNPEDASAGTRTLPFSREIWIEQDDFREDPPRKFFRLSPGREVRLKHAYLVTCTDVVKDASGNVTEVHCTYDPESRGGDAPDGRRVKGTLHWVSAQHARQATVRLYDRLFTVENPLADAEADWKGFLNPQSLMTLTDCQVEPELAGATPGASFQFLRNGYFAVDDDSTAESPLFNRTATLRDSWAKIEKAANRG